MAVRNPEKRLVQAAMTLAAERPWNEVSYRDIAALAGLPLAEAWRAAPGRPAILGHLSRMADQAVLDEPAADRDGDARDRLFDVLMRRFDALRPHREGLASVVASASRDPAVAVAGGLGVLRSMQAMLVAAAVPADGVSGLIKAKGLSLIWLTTLRSFLKDESEDLAPTMAALDQQLRRAEWLMGRFGRRRQRPDAPPPVGEEEAL